MNGENQNEKKELMLNKRTGAFEEVDWYPQAHSEIQFVRFTCAKILLFFLAVKHEYSFHSKLHILGQRRGNSRRVV